MLFFVKYDNFIMRIIPIYIQDLNVKFTIRTLHYVALNTP